MSAFAKGGFTAAVVAGMAMAGVQAQDIPPVNSSMPAWDLRRANGGQLPEPKRVSGAGIHMPRPSYWPVVAAFGDQSSDWARVVTVSGSHPLRAVLAPLGDTWIVIGVLAAPPG